MGLDLDVLENANMTQTQLQIWVAQMLAGRKPVFNMGMAIEIQAELDVDRFRQAFDDVVAASDNMRSVFRFADGGPQRSVVAMSDVEYEIPELEFSSRSAAQAWMAESITKRINLKKRLFDSALLKIGPKTWIWYICMHHLICDGFTFGNLTEWLGNRYAQLMSGEASDFEIPAFQDFVTGELDYYGSEQGATAGRFWDEVAKEPLPPWSFFGSDSDIASNISTRAHREMSASVVLRMKKSIAERQFRAFTADQGIYLLLLTAMFVHLKAASGNDDFCVAVCLHNRVTPQDKKTLGPFFIHSSLRIRVLPDDSFASLYNRVSAEYRKMLRHYRHPVSAPPGQRVWDATVNYVNKTFPRFAGFPTHVDWLRSGFCSSEELLGLQIHRFNGGEGMELEWDFNAGVFDDERIKSKAIEGFDRILEYGLDNPAAPLEPLWKGDDADGSQG